MTFVGKLFVMLNLAISFVMAVVAFGLFVTNLDYDSASKSKSGQPQPPAKYTELRKEINDILSTIPAVEGSWRNARKPMLESEEQRRADHRWYESQFDFARTKATDADPVKVVELEKNLPKPDPANFNRPTMKPSDPRLQSLDYYISEWQKVHLENAGILKNLQTEIDEDIRLTHLLTGTTEPLDKRSKDEGVTPRLWRLGYRQMIVDEQDKRKGLEAEINSVRPLFTQTDVESALVRKRYESLLERIKELKTYLQKRHKVDVAMGRR